MKKAPIPISFTAHDFWTKIKLATSGNKVGYFQAKMATGGFVYLVAFKDTVKMIPFVRKKEELFEKTVERVSKANHLSVVINGPTYGLTMAGKFDALVGNDPVPANDTLQQGLIVYNKVKIAGSSSNMYYIANTPNQIPKYKFGQGVAPTNVNAALGNMGPLLINKMRFGPLNKYLPPQPHAIKHGEPNAKYAPFLTQRSNNRFVATSALPDSTGKIVIGYSKIHSALLIVLQPNGTIGISISGLRDILADQGLDSAVYLDGSDSVMLMLNNSFVVKQGQLKNETNITGVGFKY